MDSTYNLNGGFKPTLKRFADLEGPDFFPTPRWATFALIDNERFEGEIWECACGNGAMSRVLEETGCSVPSSDLYDRGHGDAGIDFLTVTRQADNIITNPPYNSAEGFVANGVKLARRKFALLLRLAFLEGAKQKSGSKVKFGSVRAATAQCRASWRRQVVRSRVRTSMTEATAMRGSIFSLLLDKPITLSPIRPTTARRALSQTA